MRVAGSAMRAISRSGLLSRDFSLQHRADDAVFGAGAGTNGNGVEAILRGQRIARVRTAQARADDAPIRRAGGKQIVDDDSLMRPVKRADAEVDDAGRDPRAVVIRAADLAGKPAEVGVREAQIALNRVGIADFRHLP